MNIADSTVADFQKDGVVVLRGVFRNWVEVLSQGVAEVMAHPSPLRNKPAAAAFPSKTRGQKSQTRLERQRPLRRPIKVGAAIPPNKAVSGASAHPPQAPHIA